MSAGSPGIDYERLYAYRFRDTDQGSRTAVWGPIAEFIHRAMGEPQRVLDPAAGRGEFISAVPASERWAVDRTEHVESSQAEGFRMLIGDVMEVELPENHFDGIFVSNFLEHLSTQEAIGSFLAKMLDATRRGGRIAIMGPNYRYCSDAYWDFADHVIALTHRAVEEHLYAAGFEPVRTIPRFLPYSFTGSLPASAGLTAAYLRLRPAWRLFGKQFLVIGEKPGTPA
jgi:methyltransferase family protein